MLKKYFLFSFLLLISFFAFTNDQKNSLIETYNKTYDRELVDIVIKDNIDIKGKVTSAGSLALSDNIAEKNAFVVNKLIQANYFIFGKANLKQMDLFPVHPQ